MIGAGLGLQEREGDESKGERSSSGMKRRGASRAFEHVMKRERERERDRV